MAETQATGLRYNTVAIGIDKDKNSQQAVKWAIDNLLMKGKITQVVLIHVKNQLPTANDFVPKTGRPPTESELQQLFLLYRGFCARKGIIAEEVVLHDMDTASALMYYISYASIGTIVVGASSRNALTRRFKQLDVPTSLAKSAPEFCAVYVISKGKVQSTRTAKRPAIMASHTSTPKSDIPTTVNSYCTSNPRSSPGNSFTSESPRSSKEFGNAGNGENTVSRGSSLAPGSPPPQFYSNASSDDTLSSIRADSRRSLGLLPPHSTQPYSYVSTSTDDSSRFYSRDSWRSEDFERMSFESRSNESPYTPPRVLKSLDNQEGQRKYSYELEKPISYDGSSYSSSSNGSFQTMNGVSFETMDHHSIGSTTFQSSDSASFPDALEDEMKKLRAGIRKTMELYQSLSNEATMAKQKAETILGKRREEEPTFEDIMLAQQTAFVVADLERLKCKAAMDAAEMSKRLVDMEAQKRKTEEDAKKRATPFTPSSLHYRLYTSEDIEVATNNFSTSLQIGAGGYGPVYKATLDHIPVAIKVLRPEMSQGQNQFRKEVEVLGCIRHPHMVLLLGACPEKGCLVYEYMENGSLEDRLFRKNDTPPIPWRTRFKIASEIATALLFLHQTKPEPMVHRDLKPANILLDANYRSKIGDVGLARLVPASADGMTQYHLTATAGTLCYIDPEYQKTGMLGTKSDVYSFGVLLLQLVTAKPAMGLTYQVEEAIERGTFAELLDPTINDWPVEEALSLAQLATRCCELRRKDRPDLASVVLPELIRLKGFAMNY